MSAQQPGTGSSPGYERRDTSARWIAFWLVLLTLLVVIAFYATRSITHALERREAAAQEEPHPMSLFRRPPATALLQAQPTAELERYEARQRELATTYGWIDAGEGIVRVPIERAMELVLERGLPARESQEER